ncbi:DUF2946 domain-containing protein [Stutzerimonas stutzeri]|uniref:DUF2946 domain-containing protein n=1 Tax=Stutzerimonas stutzeri TaxID=316 RepID=UPI0030132772
MTRKGLSTSSIWLGLFAMLMIHVGPLYSALQATAAQTSNASAHVHLHDEPGQAASTAMDHHGGRGIGGPAWLSALKFCGYCELLTLNPPLTLSLQLALPLLRPVPVHALPAKPLPPTRRSSSGYPRAPPVLPG